MSDHGVRVWWQVRGEIKSGLLERVETGNDDRVRLKDGRWIQARYARLTSDGMNLRVRQMPGEEAK